MGLVPRTLFQGCIKHIYCATFFRLSTFDFRLSTFDIVLFGTMTQQVVRVPSGYVPASWEEWDVLIPGDDMKPAWRIVSSPGMSESSAVPSATVSVHLDIAKTRIKQAKTRLQMARQTQANTRQIRLYEKELEQATHRLQLLRIDQAKQRVADTSSDATKTSMPKSRVRVRGSTDDSTSGNHDTFGGKYTSESKRSKVYDASVNPLRARDIGQRRAQQEKGRTLGKRRHLDN